MSSSRSKFVLSTVESEIDEAIENQSIQKAAVAASKITEKDFSQIIRLGKKTFYKVTKTGQTKLDHGTYISTLKIDTKTQAEFEEHKLISARRITLAEKINHKEMQFVKVRYSKNSLDDEAEMLVDVEQVTERSYHALTALGIAQNNRPAFADAIVSAFIYADLPRSETSDVNPGFNEAFTDFLTPERHALLEEVQAHLKIEDENAQSIAVKNYFVELVNEFPLLRQELTAACAGFITRAIGLQNNPIFWFWERSGNAGKTTLASMVNAAFLHKSEVMGAQSTGVGIERKAYSANDSFLFIDEIQHYANGDKQKIANMIHQIAIGGNRAKAGKGAKTRELNFKMSAVFLANESAKMVLGSTAQAGPILSRIVEIEVPALDTACKKFREDKAKLTKAKMIFEKNSGFLSKTIVEMVIEKQEVLIDSFLSAQDYVMEQVGKTNSNGRNVDVLAAYLCSSFLLEEIGVVQMPENEILNMMNELKVSDEEEAENQLDVLHQIYNALHKHTYIKGYFAAFESDLKDSVDAETQTVTRTAAEKQEARATEITHKNKSNGIYCYARFDEQMQFEQTEFSHASIFALTKKGFDLANAICDISSLIAFCEKNEMLKINDHNKKGIFKYKIAGVGNTICFDIKKIKAFLKQKQKEITNRI
jgi:hypothetical protein